MSQAVDTLEPTSERRASLRVPVERTVRVGPAHATPRATMSAADISRGGVFIDAPTAVRVGSRFSAELELSTGEHVYIPEAEVAHVGGQAGQGFGIRFINLPARVEQVLSREMDRLDPQRTGRPIEIGTSLLPAPQPSGLVLAEDEDGRSGGPSSSAWIEPMTALPEPLDADTEIDTKSPMRMPSHWMLLLGLGCLFLAAAAGFVIMAELDAPSPTVESVPLDRGLPDETHDVLMEKAKSPALQPTPPEDVNLAPLPLVPEKTPEAARAPLRTAPAPGRHARPARRADSAEEEAPSREARPRAASASASDARVVEFDLPTDARVKTAYALKAPPRFVIDLTGVDQAPKARGRDPLVRGVRFGRHPGFARLVLDLTRSLDSGAAQLRGGRLSVRLVPTSAP